MRFGAGWTPHQVAVTVTSLSLHTNALAGPIPRCASREP